MIKLKDILLESDKILIPRRNKEDREKNHIISIQRQIQNYIKNGDDYDLEFDNTPIQSIPDNLKFVGGGLNLFNTKIKSLPDNLTVDGSLDIRHTKLTKLPENLTVIYLFVDSRLLMNQIPKNLNVSEIMYINNFDGKKVYTEKKLKNLFPDVNKFTYMF